MKVEYGLASRVWNARGEMRVCVAGQAPVGLKRLFASLAVDVAWDAAS